MHRKLAQRTVARKLTEPSQIDSNTPSLKREDWLENFAVGIRDNMLVLDPFLPEKAVIKDTAKYRVFSKKGFFKAAPKRAETALPEQSALQYSEDLYVAFEYALEGWVSDDSIRNAAVDLEPFFDETEYLTRKIMLTQEILIANEITSAIKAAGASFFTSLLAAGNWNGGASADILGNISTAIRAVALNAGKRPNLMAMNTDTYESVLNDTTIVDILKRSGRDVITDARPISALRGIRINIADAIVNTGTIDTPTDTNILFDTESITPLRQQVFIAFAETGDRLTFGRNFVPKAFKVLKGRGLEGERRQSSLVAVWKKLAPKVTNVNAGYIIGNVLGVA